MLFRSAALLDDLESRGMLDDTFVMMLGEFGRTPKINKERGRDHWGPCFFGVFAGGGVRPGQIIGQTDSHAGLPIGDAFTPSDLAATIFHLFGIDTNAEFKDSRDRPYRVYLGEPIRSLM